MKVIYRKGATKTKFYMHKAVGDQKSSQEYVYRVTKQYIDYGSHNISFTTLTIYI